MRELPLSFETSLWDQYRMTKQLGDEISAVDLLTMLERENDAALEDALQDMAHRY